MASLDLFNFIIGAYALILGIVGGWEHNPARVALGVFVFLYVAAVDFFTDFLDSWLMKISAFWFVVVLDVVVGALTLWVNSKL